jgi:hypothetical protein
MEKRSQRHSYIPHLGRRFDCIASSKREQGPRPLAPLCLMLRNLLSTIVVMVPDLQLLKSPIPSISTLQ